jgi:shikimate dehydrogenase
MEITSATQLCAVIGDPVEHSLSPAIHNAAFHAVGLDFVYLAFRVQDVEGCLRGLRALEGFRGLSVTIPHKSAVIPFLDYVEGAARFCESVNTVVKEGGRLCGYSTDGSGVLRAFAEAGLTLEDQSVLFLGAGGAVRAVAYAVVTRAKPGGVWILARRRNRAESLRDKLREVATCPVEAGELTADLAAAMNTCDVVINGTPVGMYPHHTAESPVPADYWQARHIAFDMVYRPRVTRFLREAREAGGHTVEGLEMLVHQAAEQFERWTAHTAPVAVMRAAVIRALESPAAISVNPSQED